MSMFKNSWTVLNWQSPKIFFYPSLWTLNLNLNNLEIIGNNPFLKRGNFLNKERNHSWPKVKTPFTPYSVFTPYSGFTPGTPVFTHYTSARQRYSPVGWWMCRTEELNWESNQIKFVTISMKISKICSK